MSSQDLPEMDIVTAEGKLLSPQERGACQRLALQEEAPHSQRAQALLALDEGATQPEAGLRAGLTVGQVKYWLGKFRKVGLDIFPEQVVMDTAESSQEEQKAKKTKKPKGKKGKGSKKKKAKKPKKKGKKAKPKKGKDEGKKKGKKENK